MGKKLIDKEIRAREVSKAVLKIKALEKFFEQDIVESACVKYKLANVDKRRATQQIQDMEKQLADAKRRLK